MYMFAILELILIWLSLFFCGYFIRTKNVIATIVGIGCIITGWLAYFMALAIEEVTIPSTLPTSPEVGMLGIFLILNIGSSTGLGYLIGKVIEG